MRTKTGFWGILIVLAVLVPVSVRADGKIWDIRPSRPVAENEQVAAIAYKDGIQKMILAVNFELAETDGAIWIFPVPGLAEEVSLEVLREIRGSGRNTARNFRQSVSDLHPFGLCNGFLIPP